MQNSRGFTLIELVMVIVILGILAAVAIPRFANFSDEARTQAVQGTRGAFAQSVSNAHLKAELESISNDDLDLDDQGGDDVFINSNGYPQDAAGSTGSDAAAGANVWNGILSSAPSISTTDDVEDWYVNSDGNTPPVYTYEYTANGHSFTYDAGTGEVSQVIVP